MTAANQVERRHQAMMQLVEYRRWKDKRDELICEAVGAGMSKTDIAFIVGMRRATINDILARSGDGVTSYTADGPERVG